MSFLRITCWCGCIVCASLLCSFARGQESVILYVSPDGRDTNLGNKSHPLATPEGAQTRARQLRTGKNGVPLEVIFAPGVYTFSRSLKLTPQDGGDSLAPVLYHAVKGGEVHFTGGRSIAHFRPVTDRTVLKYLDPACAGKILECDLQANGITNLGSLRPRGFGKPVVPSPLELFAGTRPMTLARWPNKEWVFIADTIAGTRDTMFLYDGDRPSRWTREPEIWLHGYWTHDWADSYVRVGAIDTSRKIITTKAPHGVYGYTPHRRYVAINVLAELDEPGEYYVDRSRGFVYFWPTSQADLDELTVSMLESPLVVLDNTAWVTFAGFTIECTRGAGVEIIGGHHNTLAGCTLRNIGSVAVTVGKLEPSLGGTIGVNTLFDGLAGHDNGVLSCDIAQCGEGGVILCGGDRATLTPGRNFVDNCRITDCCRWSQTYRAGVFMWGVGNRVSNSVIHGLPHSAAFFWGNDHVLEYNEIYDVCGETGDAGALYQGRDWTQRGNTIRYNYFHDVRGVQGQEGFTDVMSVYMDDFASGTTVLGNVFVNGGRSVMIGGGRDNLVENNLFIDGHPAVHVDARGKRGWAAAMFDGANSVLMERLRAVRHTEPPYRMRYPRLVRLLEETYGMPENNIIRRNISYGGIWRELQDGVTDSLVLFEGNFVEEDPGFVSAATRDFRLRPDAPVFQKGFQRLPVEKIGLYTDVYRGTVQAPRKNIPGSIAEGNP